MDEINAIAKEFGLYVIEDAAESMGSLYHGKYTGSLGGMGCFRYLWLFFVLNSPSVKYLTLGLFTHTSINPHGFTLCTYGD